MNLNNSLKIFYLLLIFLCSSLASVFGSEDLDKLLQKLESHPQHDSTRITILNDIAWVLTNSNTEAMLPYIEEILVISNEINHETGHINAYKLLGIHHWLLGENEEALTAFNKGLKMAIDTNTPRAIAALNSNIGLVHLRRAEYFKAYQSHKAANEIASKNGFKYVEAISALNMADDLYRNENYQRSIDILSHLENFVDSNDFDNKNYIKEIALLTKAKVYFLMKDTRNAIVHLEKSIPFVQATENHRSIIDYHLTKGKINVEKGNLAKAKVALSTAYDYANKGKFISEKAEILGEIAHLLYIRNEWEEALDYAQEALKYSTEVQDILSQINAHKCLSLVYWELNDTKPAFEHSTQHLLLQDSLNAIIANNNLNQLDYEYTINQKANEHELLVASNNADKAKLLKNNFRGISVLCVLFLVGAIAFYLFRNKKMHDREHQKLEEIVRNRTRNLEEMNNQLIDKNEELERFAYITSHDLKEPLRNINGFIKLIERKTKGALDKETQEYFDFIVDNTTQMQRLVHDVLFFTKIAKLEEAYREVNLNDLVASIIDQELSEILQERYGSITHTHLPNLETNIPQLKVLLKHLVKNGLTYNKSYEPEVHITYENNQESHIIHVTDNGIGIEEAYHQKIFDMFKRLHNRQEYKGSGIGLAICKKIVTMLGGEIKVSSEVGEGSTFSVYLPIEHSVVGDFGRKEGGVSA